MLESKSTSKSTKLAHLIACTDPVTVAMHFGVEDQNMYLDCGRECVRETFEVRNTLAIDEDEQSSPAPLAENHLLALEELNSDSKKRSLATDIDNLPTNIWPEEPSLKKIRVDRNIPPVDAEIQNVLEEYYTPRATAQPMVMFDGKHRSSSHLMDPKVDGDDDNEVEMIDSDDDKVEMRESMSTKSYHSDMDQEESEVHKLSTCIEGLLVDMSGCSVDIDDDNSR